MCEYLNQIFYNNNKFDKSNDILLLERFMLTKDKIQSILDERPINNVENTTTKTEEIKEIINKSEIPINKSEDLFYPDKTDSLFWCLYIAKHGITQYMSIGTKYNNEEIHVKQQVIDFIKKNPQNMKETNKKLTKVAIQEIMSGLMVNKTTAIDTVIALCCYYKISIFIVKDFTYLEFTPNNVSDIFIIYKKDNRFKIDLNTTEEKINKIKTNLHQIDCETKPLRGISTYKMSELTDIAKKIGVFNDKQKYKKEDLYKYLYSTIYDNTIL